MSALDDLYSHFEARMRAEADRLAGDVALAMFLQGDGYLDRLRIVSMPVRLGVPDAIASKWGDW